MQQKGLDNHNYRHWRITLHDPQRPYSNIFPQPVAVSLQGFYITSSTAGTPTIAFNSITTSNPIVVVAPHYHRHSYHPRRPHLHSAHGHHPAYNDALPTVFNELFRYHKHLEGQVIPVPHSPNEMGDRWRNAERIESAQSKKVGITIGTVDIGLHANILKGLMRTGDGAMGKECVWASRWNWLCRSNCFRSRFLWTPEALGEICHSYSTRVSRVISYLSPERIQLW